MWFKSGFIALAFGVGFVAPTAQADLAHRFWLGWKRAACSEQIQNFEGVAYACNSHHTGQLYSYMQLLSDLNGNLIPATLRMGAVLGNSSGVGLTSYLPSAAFLNSDVARLRELRARGIDLPDEVALFEYASPRADAAIRATAMGQAYTPLNDVYFDFGRLPGSRSRIVDASVWDAAQGIGANRALWLRHDPIFSLRPSSAVIIKTYYWARRPRVTQEAFETAAAGHLTRMRDESTGILINSLMFVERNYWIEYRMVSGAPEQASDVAAAEARIADALRASAELALTQTCVTGAREFSSAARCLNTPRWWGREN